MFAKQKKGNMYLNLAIFSLAAAGVVTIAHKTKKFIAEKGSAMSEFFKKER
jgi:cell division protein FtsL